MKILVLLSPLIEMASPSAMLGCYSRFVPRLLKALKTITPSVHVTCAMNEYLPRVIDDERLPHYGDFKVVFQKDLLGDYRFDGLDGVTRWQKTQTENPCINSILEAIRHALGAEYKPDLVLSFTPFGFIRKLYPWARFAQVECGPFSRAPYPETLLLDPYGYGHNYYYSQFADKLNGRELSVSVRSDLAAYRKAILTLLRSSAVIGKFFEKIKIDYRRILILPLGFDQFHEMKLNNSYQGQFEFVEHVLDSVSKDTAIILTQHPHSSALTGNAVRILKLQHLNLINEDWFAAIDNFSQIAAAYADGVVTLSSTVGLQAAFLGKYFIAPTGYCAGIADCTSVENIPMMFSRTPKDRDAFFFWILTHYAMLDEQLPPLFNALFKSPPDRPFEYPSFCAESEFHQLILKYQEIAKTSYHKALAGIDQLGLDHVWEQKPLWAQLNASKVRRDAVALDYPRIVHEVEGLRIENDRLRTSASYRIGQLLTWPIRKIRH